MLHRVVKTGSGAASEAGQVHDNPRKASRKKSLPSTKDAILDAAEDLLTRRSYNAFSYQHIAVQLGIRNAAIHYHFPSKGDLGTALIKRYRQRFQEWVVETEAAHGDDPWTMLQGYFQICQDYLEADGKACPSGVLGIEYEAIPDTMRSETREMLKEIYEWLISVLQRGRDNGRLRFCGSVEGKAIQLGCSLQGALQIARCTDASRFHQVVEQLEADLKPC